MMQDVEEILVLYKMPHKYIFSMGQKEGYESSECHFLELCTEPLVQLWLVALDVPFWDFSLVLACSPSFFSFPGNPGSPASNWHS